MVWSSGAAADAGTRAVTLDVGPGELRYDLTAGEQNRDFSWGDPTPLGVGANTFAGAATLEGLRLLQKDGDALSKTLRESDPVFESG